MSDLVPVVTEAGKWVAICLAIPIAWRAVRLVAVLAAMGSIAKSLMAISKASAESQKSE